MITLVNQFAANIEEKKGSITDDEVTHNATLNHGCYGISVDYCIQIHLTQCWNCQPSDKVGGIT